jgi:glutamyl-tRNA reductase
MPDRPATVAVAGVSHTCTPAAVREHLHVTPDGAATVARALAGEAREAVVLVTCNRTELYVTGTTFRDARERAASALADLGGGFRLPSTAYVHANQFAARHLFRVAAGLDAIVLGDMHVAAQVKQAHRTSRAARATGPLLNRLFEAAAAARIAGPLSERRLLVIGAGTIAEVAARNAASRDCREIVVASRDVLRARALADLVGGRAASFNSLDTEVAAADVVVSATAAPGFVLTADTIPAALARRRQRPLAVFDLALPRDVDPAIRNPRWVQLLDLDDLAGVVAAAGRGRRADLDRAEEIADEEAQRYETWRRSRAATPAIVALRGNAEQARQYVLSRHAPALARLAPDERGLVETITAQVVAKLLHEPTIDLRQMKHGHAP